MEDVIQAGAAAGLELRGLEDFDAVVEAHRRRIYRLLVGMLGDPDAAETLTQDCFLRAYRARSSYRGEASVAGWLVGIAVNLARDHARSRRAGNPLGAAGRSGGSAKDFPGRSPRLDGAGGACGLRAGVGSADECTSSLGAGAFQ
jgi:DNA-directed RNA polymerase specialized sigma24 family protein